MLQNLHNSQVIYRMQCERKHILTTQRYLVLVTKHQLLITISSTSQPKYLLDLNMETVLHFQTDKSRLPITFGFLYKGSIKYFHAPSDQIELLRLTLKGKVLYSDVHSFYQPIEQIGVGLTSTVQTIRCLRSGQLLVYKKIVKSSQLNQRFQQKILLANEMQKASRLNHACFANVYECFQDDKAYYITMEYCKGGTLEEFLLQKKKISASEADPIFRQILLALKQLQDKNIVHRDIKLSNFMFRQNKTLVLIDFGFASDVYHQRFGRGTPGYMPPEYFKDDISGTWNDIFSAGAVFFKMLTGRNLFPGDTVEELAYYNQNYILQPPEVWDELTPKHRKMVKHMITEDPYQRLSADTLLNILDQKKTLSKSVGVGLMVTAEDDVNEEVVEVEIHWAKEKIMMPVLKCNRNNLKSGFNSNQVSQLLNTPK